MGNKESLEDSLRVIVWYGLDQLREMVEMFSPLDGLILPTQLQDRTLPSFYLSKGRKGTIGRFTIKFR